MNGFISVNGLWGFRRDTVTGYNRASKQSYNYINGRDVQRKNVVNNVDKSSLIQN